MSSLNSGAGEESRTLDLNLGKVALYQLSYSRIFRAATIDDSTEFASERLYTFFLPPALPP